MGGDRRRREPPAKARLPEGEIPAGAWGEAQVARTEGGRDRGAPLARRPEDVAGTSRGLAAGRPLRRMVRALLLDPLDRGARGGGHPEGTAPAGEGAKGNSPLGCG